MNQTCVFLKGKSVFKTRAAWLDNLMNPRGIRSRHSGKFREMYNPKGYAYSPF